MINREQVLQSHGAQVVGRDGDKIGTVVDIYLDRETDQPEWAVVNTGMLGTRSTFVPLQEASMEGNDIVVPYDKDKVKGAPSMEAEGQLSQQEEGELYGYYGLQYSEARSDTGLPEGREAGVGTTDDAMTRSEEELRVGKAAQERGRVRLKKHVVTEPVRESVPVTREEARVEREPITDANIDPATSGPEISEAEHEVSLREEQPVVEKQAVPKERVRLAKEQVTEEQPVEDEVRREVVEEEGDSGTIR